MGNPFAAETELFVMGMLRDSPKGCYGLELVNESGGRLKRGTVYVTLGRLQEKGFVTSKVKASAERPGMPRPVYRLTGAGARVLAGAELAGWQCART